MWSSLHALFWFSSVLARIGGSKVAGTMTSLSPATNTAFARQMNNSFACIENPIGWSPVYLAEKWMHARIYSLDR